MSGHNVYAMANEFYALLPHMPQMKVQKLLYMTLGWGLAIHKRRVIRNRIEAWDGGPVFPDLYQQIRHQAHYDKHGLLADPITGKAYKADLTKEEKGLIKAVWRRYGDYSASELSAMTHQPGTPWTETYVKHGRNHEIPKELIQAHFTELGEAGRAK